MKSRHGRATVIGDECPTVHWETGKAGQENDPKVRKPWGEKGAKAAF